MTNKSTKKALALSIISLVVCVSMLVGTTFAWFTDSVTSANNKIIAGNLKVDLEVLTETATDTYEWVSVKNSNSPIFDYDLWEPGYTEVKVLKVENEGTLALKWKATFSSANELGILADVIDVYVKEDVTAYPADRADLSGWTKVGTVRDFVNTLESTTTGTLLAKTSETLGIALKMQETAGNEYQDETLGAFDITILATQLASEKDSFDEKYDAFADYDGEISTPAALVDALKKGGTYKLVADITLDEGDKAVIPAGTVVNLDLDNKTITGTKGRDADNNRIHVIVNNGILTIKDGTVKSAGNDGGSAIYNNAGATLTIEDVTLYGAPQSDPVYEAGVSKPFPSYAVNNYGNAIVNGATVKSYHGAIATGDNGVTVINDADIDVGLGQSTGITSYLIYSFGNAQVTVNGGEFAFTKQEIYVNGGNTFCELGNNPIMINGGNYIGTSFSTGAGREYVIKGGTFDKDPSAYVADSYLAVKNADGTWSVVSVVGKTLLTEGLYVSNDKDYAVVSADGLVSLNSMMANRTAGKNVTVELLADVDMTGKTWTPVDSHSDTAFSFAGLNGNNHAIQNLTINGQAMFTRFAGSGDVVIKDVTFENATVNSSAINTSILTVQSYQNVTLDNVDVIDCSITGAYKVAPFIATVYNEGSSTVTATLKNCDVKNTTVKATTYDFCTAGMVAFVYAGDNDKIEFENCTVSGVKLIAPNDSYKAHAFVYTTGSGSLYNEAEGVTVSGCTFEKL